MMVWWRCPYMEVGQGMWRKQHTDVHRSMNPDVFMCQRRRWHRGGHAR